MEQSIINKLDEIKDRIVKERESRDKRKVLRSLVDEHGVEVVAHVLGLSLDSLVVYLRTSPSPVSSHKLELAEQVLAELTK